VDRDSFWGDIEDLGCDLDLERIQGWFQAATRLAWGQMETQKPRSRVSFLEVYIILRNFVISERKRGHRPPNYVWSFLKEKKYCNFFAYWGFAVKDNGTLIPV